jgi:hypothetical protein
VIKRLGDLAQAEKIGELQVKGRKVPAVVYILHGLA